MRSINGSIKGVLPIANTSFSNGVFDSNDAYNFNILNSWPQVPPSVRIVESKTTMTEDNDTVSFDLFFVGLDTGEELNYRIAAVGTSLIQSSDFSSSTSGSIVVPESYQSSLSITTNPDTFDEGTENFVLEISSSSAGVIGVSQTIQILDTSTGGGSEPLLTSWTDDIISSVGVNSTTSQNIVNIYYRRAIMAWTYTAAELSAAFGKGSATISGLRFLVSQQPNNQPLPDYAIGMKNGTFGDSNPGNTGYTVVKNPSSESFATGTTKTFENFDTPFVWNGGDLAIMFAWGQCPINYDASGQNPIGNGTLYYNRTDSSGAYTINVDSIGNTLSNHRPVIQLFG